MSVEVGVEGAVEVLVGDGVLVGGGVLVGDGVLVGGGVLVAVGGCGVTVKVGVTEGSTSVGKN